VYDHDLEEVAALGWEEFIGRQWESIFAGYRARAGLRRICRRWSDLLEAGLGCPQEVADLLVRNQIIDRADRDLEGTIDTGALVAGMAGVVADVRTDLAELAEAPAGPADGLLAAHARLLNFIHAYAFGSDDDTGLPVG
jgi:hypothetical protein